MKIYTYYENIEFKQQDELVKLWKSSWESKGFQAIVLGRSDAENHNFYKEFVSELEDLHMEILGEAIKPYGMSCYLRWLAYAHVLESKSFVSDYDVINSRLDLTDDLPSGLMFYDNCCPCFASGSKEDFLNFCFDILKITKQNLNNLKGKVHPWYHDQECIVHNKTDFQHLNYVTIEEKDPIDRLIQQYEHKNFFIKKKSKVLHFSHGSIGHAKENFPELKDENSDELRLKLIKDILS